MRRGRSVIPIITLMGISLSTGCNEQGYTPTASEIQAQAGSAVVPPKVDILLAEDDSGSIAEIYPTISQQMPGFLIELENRGWDYHFATIPLTTERPLNQVAASRYDPNWGSLWTPPYPGAPQKDPGMIASSVFKQLDHYSDFIQPTDVTNVHNGQELGFEMIRATLYNRVKGTGFLRSDALLVILVVGNGNDTSGVTFCTRSDGFMAPCETLGYPQYGTMQLSFDYYKSKFQGIKDTPSKARFYAAVANQQSTNCLGSKSFAGIRYQNMAIATGGKYYDICSEPVAKVLDSVASELHSTRLSFRTRYLFIAQEPNVDTIRVTRYTNGDPARPSIIPQDATNGWTYAGNLTDVYAIDSPSLMNLSSGYAIELHGTAKLMGNDTASVTYVPFGATSAVSR